MTKKKDAEMLQRLIKPVPVKVKNPKNQKKNAWLHPIEWFDQVMIDAQISEMISTATDKGLGKTAIQALTFRVVAIVTIQSALYTKNGEDTKGEPVFTSLAEAFSFYKGGKAAECFDLFEVYAKAFEITDEQKKS